MFNFSESDMDDLFGLQEIGDQEIHCQNLVASRPASHGHNLFSDERIPETSTRSRNIEFQNPQRSIIGQLFNVNRVSSSFPCSQSLTNNNPKDPIDYFSHLLKDYDFERPTDTKIHFSSLTACAKNKENFRTLPAAGLEVMQNRSNFPLHSKKLPSDPICLTETEDGSFVCTPLKPERSSSKSAFRTSFMPNVVKPTSKADDEVKVLPMERGKRLLSLHNLPHPDVISKKKRFSKMFPAPAESVKSNRCTSQRRDKFSQHLIEVKRRCSVIGDVSRSTYGPPVQKRPAQNSFQFNLAEQENFGAKFSDIQPSPPFFLPQNSSVGKQSSTLTDPKLNDDNNFHFEPKFFINPKLTTSSSRPAVTEATLINHFETPDFNNALVSDTDFEPFKSPPWRNPANRDFIPHVSAQNKKGPTLPTNDFFWTTGHEP